MKINTSGMSGTIIMVEQWRIIKQIFFEGSGSQKGKEKEVSHSRYKWNSVHLQFKIKGILQIKLHSTVV